jgi:hypothetical protein
MNEAEVSNILMLNKAALALVLGTLFYVYRRYVQRCNCEKCSFHVNEYRVERMRKADEDHEDTHRMWGKCGNMECPKNPRKDEVD